MLCRAFSFAAAVTARSPALCRSKTIMASAVLSDADRFAFDLNGFLVVRSVFSPEEVATANAGIDAHTAELQARVGDALRNANEGTPMSAKGPRLDLGGMLFWDHPHCNLFRNVLAHPKLVPYLNAFCGEGYRMDHQPIVIAQDRDSEGFMLHGGPISGDDGVPSGRFNPELQYRCEGGHIWTTLLAVAVQLVDHNPGDGGFCVLRGSHKLNLPVPLDVVDGVSEVFHEHIHQPVTKAGDVVIWSEATVHGATPWRGEQQRRIALYRFAPANMGYGRGYLEIPPEKLAQLTPLQRAVLEAPYATRLERPLVTPEVAASGAAPHLKQRSEAKKDLDRKLFGTAYF